MDTTGKDPAILSTCVKHWRFFACKVGLLLQDRTKFGTAGLFQKTEHAKAVYKLFFIPSPWRPNLTLLRKKCKRDFASKNSTETRKINAAAFELVELRPKQSGYDQKKIDRKKRFKVVPRLFTTHPHSYNNDLRKTLWVTQRCFYSFQMERIKTSLCHPYRLS